MESSTSTVVNINQIFLSSQKDKPRLWLLFISGSVTLHLVLASLLYWLLVNKRVTTQVTVEQITIEIVAIAATPSKSPSSNSLPTATQEKSPPPSPNPKLEQTKVTRFSDLRPIAKTNSIPPNQANYRLSSEIKSDSPTSQTPSSSFTRFSDLPNSNFPRQRQGIQTSETFKTSSSVRRFSDLQSNSSPIKEDLVSSNSNPFSSPVKVPTNPSNSSSVRRFSDLQGNSSPIKENLVSSNSRPLSPPNSSSVNRLIDAEGSNFPTQETGRKFSNDNNSLSQESLGGGLIATIIGNPQITNTQKDIPDQYARPRKNEIRLSSTDYLTDANININQTLRLKVIVLIDDQGKAEVIPNKIQVLVGDISSIAAENLLKKVISNWEFEPTYMAEGAVFQSYYLTVQITPF